MHTRQRHSAGGAVAYRWERNTETQRHRDTETHRDGDGDRDRDRDRELGQCHHVHTRERNAGGVGVACWGEVGGKRYVDSVGMGTSFHSVLIFTQLSLNFHSTPSVGGLKVYLALGPTQGIG